MISPLKTMQRGIAVFAVGFAALVAFGESAAASGGFKRVEELFRHAQYDHARRALAADTASLEATSLDEALLMFAQLETDFAKAQGFYRRVMASPDTRAAQRARLELAKMHYASGDYQIALEILSARQAGGSERDESEARYFSGLCHKQLGDNVRAAVEFERITRGSYAPWSILARAEIDAQEGRIAEAIKKYEDLGESRPNPIAIFKLGECYEKVGEGERALSQYRLLIDEFPRSLEAAKGKEKMQLLTQPRTKPRERRPTEGGESGERTTNVSKPSVAAGRGFTIQFGSFSTRGNALAVSRKLEDGFRGVRIESVEMEGRIWHRVRAGFYETREAAEKDLARAKDRLGLAGTIVPLN